LDERGAVSAMAAVAISNNKPARTLNMRHHPLTGELPRLHSVVVVESIRPLLHASGSHDRLARGLYVARFVSGSRDQDCFLSLPAPWQPEAREGFTQHRRL